MGYTKLHGFKDYFVTKEGKIFSNKKNNNMMEIKHLDNGKGYKKVTLYVDSKPVQKYVHRLVAETFLSNPNEYKEINHIDKNKSNNNVNNIEWCTRKHNNLHSQTHLNSKKSNKPVTIVKNNVFYCFGSLREAAKCGFSRNCITNALNNNDGIATKYTVLEVG